MSPGIWKYSPDESVSKDDMVKMLEEAKKRIPNHSRGPTKEEIDTCARNLMRFYTGLEYDGGS